MIVVEEFFSNIYFFNYIQL